MQSVNFIRICIDKSKLQFTFFWMCHIVWWKSVNQNYIHKDINSRLNSEDVCYHSVQNLFVIEILIKNKD
jgi:hypothetical protein